MYCCTGRKSRRLLGSVFNDVVLKGHQLNPTRICSLPVNVYKLQFPEIQFFSTIYIHKMYSSIESRGFTMKP